LVYAPKAVLEYSVLHELCHLEHLTHGSEFWAFLEKAMPDYEERKVWLEENEQFLRVF
jgi:hypothetical protein